MAQDNFEIRGELVAHGKAPFNHKEGNNESYFVTTKSNSGKEHTQWGADLDRALKVSDASVGDKIHIKQDTALNKTDDSGKALTGAKVTYDIGVTEKAPKGFEIRGELVTHGKAPYKEGDDKDSYFVTTKSGAGKEHTQWGVDLERAVKVSGASVGDKVHIKQDMTLEKKDESGNKIAGSKAIYDIDVTEKAPKSFEIRGELVAHGKAPFNHKEGNNESYFVTTKSGAGKEHTQWGADLERAVKVSGASVGDKVHLSHTGSREFNIKEPDSDKHTSAKKVFYDLNVTDKAKSVEKNPHLDALKAIPELKKVSSGDLDKLAALRQVAEENTSGKPRAVASTLAKFDTAVKDPAFREASLKAISQDNTPKTQSKEAELSR